MKHWIFEHEEIWFWVGGISAALFDVSLTLLPRIATAIPVNYFRTRNGQSARRGLGFQQIVLEIAKTTIGLVLVCLGIIMLFVPGQGVLTIVIGIMLMSFPGKRKLEIWLIRRKKIFAVVNWLRAKRSKPPIEMP